MDPFLLVLPVGWVEVPGVTAEIEVQGENQFWSSMQQHTWSAIEPILENTNQMPAGKTITEARAIDTGDSGANRIRLFVVFGDL